MAAAKRAIQFGVNSSRFFANSSRFFANSRGFAAVDPQITRFNHNFRQFSQLQAPNNRRGLLVDTLALVRNLEAQGIPQKQAEAITNSIVQVVGDSMEKTEMLQDSEISRFIGEVKTSQDHHFSLLQRQNEKLHNDIEMLRSELRYEFDKIINAVKAQLDTGKVALIRYYIGTLASTVVVGLAFFPFMGT
ncbi:uncharacterized protein LOC110718898 isoform X2 [Chenopodium quinoa]|uniref:uncharacterized protein LOC110718898 isoform X2 n=1 Tax=Chenopodium quinoa TaxID=63459 RepID=UPI000B797A85|nr:uncharacterized protein LOC110718898 isoform X2 [Chenopodium quinoa]